MSQVKLTINGKKVVANKNQTILEVVEEKGLDEIPTLCHSPELEPYGSCFLCVVEVEGRPNLVPSCATRVMEGMVVQTKNERIIKSRKTALELLLSNHYADCVSPCKINCPAGTDAQGYIALAAMGEYKLALSLVREKNPFPAICGRICVRKCELACRREDIDEAVGVNYIKRYLSDQPGAYDDNPKREAGTNKKVCVVGSGPAGLTAAWFLGKKGHDITVYEAMPKPGGMLRYGIPEYRLPKDVLDKEIEYITRAGAKIICDQRVGKDISLEALKKEYDAVFLAPGAFRGKPMGVEHETDTEGVLTGADYLIDKASNPLPVSGTVVVVGGGNTAMDVARTSWRLGADKVIILYRRTKNEMPADKLEIEDCIKEGIEIMELAAPVGLVRSEEKLKAIKCIRMKLGEPDASGRRRPVVIEGSEFELPCSLAISAIGQSPIIKDMLTGDLEKTKVSKWNTFEIDTKTMQTNIEGLFAGGDAADDGPTVVVDAIRDGGIAAESIHAFLTGEKIKAKSFVVTKDFWSKPGQKELGTVKESPRHHMREIEVKDREGNFNEVATGYEYEDVSHEASRCLSCGCSVFDDCSLRLYAQEYNVDMERFKGHVRKHSVDDRHPNISYDPNKCVLCAKCIRTCEKVIPISALGLVNRGFSTEMRPAMNRPLFETSCISCGNCVDVCPTGALQIKHSFPGRAAIKTEKENSACGFCSVGCPTTTHRISENRYYVSSTKKPGQYLCQYGRFGPELFIQGKRILSPWVRNNTMRKEVSFRNAYDEAVKGLLNVAKKHGPESVAVFVYPELSNEEMYLASLIAREGLKTNNIGSIALLETGVKADELDEQLGFTASTANRQAIDKADLIISNNINLQTDVPVLSFSVLEAVKKNNCQLICADSAGQPLENVAKLNLDPMRGSASVLWAGVINQLWQQKFFNSNVVSGIEGAQGLLDLIKNCDLDAVQKQSGVEKNKIEEAAKTIIESKNVVIIHSLDRSRDLASGDAQMLTNLMLLLRAHGVNCDLMLPSLASNGAGLAVSGADPAFAAGRIISKKLAGASTRSELHELLQKGKIKAALVIGEDPMGYDLTASYFSDVEFLVAIDWAQTESCYFANVAIPGSTYFESEGSRCNFEGQVIHYKSVVVPASGVKTWQVLTNLALNLGLKTPAVYSDLHKELETKVKKGTGEYLPFYWNTGQTFDISTKEKLTTPEITAKPRPRTPALSMMARYKREIHEVGIENYRVGTRRY